MKETKHEHESNIEYTCPMHPEVRSDKPGICPKCGMTLVSVKKKHELNKHEGHSLKTFARKFLVCLVLTIPVILYADILKNIINLPSFPGSDYIGLVLGSVIFVYGGLVFIQGAVRELRARLPGMMTLISIAISTAF